MLKTDFPYFCAMKFKSSCILIAALAFLAWFPSCGENKNEKTENHYVIATLRGPSSMGMLQFIDSVKQMENANVEIQVFDEPLQVRKMMLDGSADFANLPTTMAALLYNKGIDYHFAAVPVWGTLYLCGNDSTIQSWDDLKGRKVYLMAKGMTPDVMFRYLMTENDLKPYEDVDLDYRFPTHIDLANATMAGRADLSVISEPYLSMALEKNPSLHILLNLSEEWQKTKGIPLAETAFICRAEIAENQKEVVDAVVQAYAKSVDWVNGNVKGAAQLAVKYGIIDDAVAAENSIPRSHLRVAAAKDVQQQIEDYLRVFYELDPQIIGGKMPDAKFYE